MPNEKDKEKPKKIGNYLVGKTIGKGGYGSVKLGTNIDLKQKVAIKKIPYGKSQKVWERAILEGENLKQLEHPSVVKLHDVIDFPLEKKVYLIMEYMEGGDLLAYIQSKKTKKLKESEARKLFTQIISGVEYIHSKGMFHRDLKPDNILMDSKKKAAKIADFGFSKGLDIQQPLMRLQSMCGSPLYCAPEILTGHPYIGMEVDMWSLGVILYGMITGCTPWPGSNLQEELQNAAKGKYIDPPGVSPEVKDLLSHLLVVDYKKRANPAEILSHTWMKQKESKVKKDSKRSGPPSPKNSEELDKDVLKKLESIGFTPEEVTATILLEQTTHASYSMYFILRDLKLKQSRQETEPLEGEF